jgi:hypothetical protein
VTGEKRDSAEGAFQDSLGREALGIWVPTGHALKVRFNSLVPKTDRCYSHAPSALDDIGNPFLGLAAQAIIRSALRASLAKPTSLTKIMRVGVL